MAIKIPSKSEKRRLTLLDCLRILAWTSYKAENNVAGLEGYEAFYTEWQNCDYFKADLPQLLAAIADLDYTEEELLGVRNEYYERRNKAKNGNSNGNGNGYDNNGDNSQSTYAAAMPDVDMSGYDEAPY